MKKLFKGGANRESRNITPLPPNPNGASTFSPPAAYSRYEQEHRQFPNPYSHEAHYDQPQHSSEPYPSYGSSSEQLGYAGSYPSRSESGSEEDLYRQQRRYGGHHPVTRSSEGSLNTPTPPDKPRSQYGQGAAYPARLQRSDPVSTPSSDDDSRRWSLRSKQGEPDADPHRHRLGWPGRRTKPPLEEEERSRSRNSMLSPNSYPVYAGYGEGNSETLISAGTGSNDGHTPTLDKGRKKFFARGPKKDKEATSPGPEPGQQQQPQQSWYKKERKEGEGLVASKIGWLCAQPSSTSDREYLLSLAEEVSRSEAASKEAAKALRKEFKYGSPDVQKRAVRVWAVLTMNSSDRFKLQIATKRFLDSIEDVLVSTKTPLSVKETVLRVLGVLAWEFKGDSELCGVTKCWNKVRPTDRPVDGEPMRPDMEEFAIPQSRPHVTTRPQSQYLPPTEYTPPSERPPPPQSQAPYAGEQQYFAPTPEPIKYASPRTPPQEQRQFVPPPEQLQYKAQSPQPPNEPQFVSPPPEVPVRYAPPSPAPESTIARANAELLIETVINSGLTEEALIAEFYDKSLRSRDTLLVQLEQPSEERTLAQVLSALEKCNEAIAMVDDARSAVVKSVSPRSRPLPGPPALHIPASMPSEEDIQTPVVPSEKALGKRRALDNLSALTIE